LFELYELRKHDNSEEASKIVSRYSALFKKVCNEAKKMFLSKKIKKSKNPIKTTWDIIKNETGRSNDERHDKIEFIMDEGKKLSNVELANYFNNYFTNFPF
jgi:predicted transcriptional regulator